MRREVKTYIKTADQLMEGDNILTPRLTVVEIVKVKVICVAQIKMVYVTSNEGTEYCFRSGETVLVIV